MTSFSAVDNNNGGGGGTIGSSGEEGEDIDDTLDQTIGLPRAYAFEPVIASPDEHSKNEDSNSSISSDSDSQVLDGEPEKGPRFHNLSWCHCAHCSVNTLNYDWECVCCREIGAIQHRIELEENPLSCITLNHHFSVLCIDKEVLDTFLLSMADVKAETLIWPMSNW